MVVTSLTTILQRALVMGTALSVAQLEELPNALANHSEMVKPTGAHHSALPGLLPGFRTASCYMSLGRDLQPWLDQWPVELRFMAAGYPAVGLWLLLIWRISQFWREERRWKLEMSRSVELWRKLLCLFFDSQVMCFSLIPLVFSNPVPILVISCWAVDASALRKFPRAASLMGQAGQGYESV